MRRRNVRTAAVAAVLVAMVTLPACGNDDDAAADTTAAPVATTGAPGTTAAPDTAAAVETTAATGPTRAEVLTIHPTALGPYALGASADEVVVGVTAALGAPDEDTGWGDTQAPCEGMGEQERFVRWGWVWANFSSGPTEYGAAGVRHLDAFGVLDQGDGSADPGVLDESGGAILGQTVPQLRARYPEARAYEGEIEGPAYTLENGLQGSLTEASDAGKVTSVHAGLVCLD